MVPKLLTAANTLLSAICGHEHDQLESCCIKLIEIVFYKRLGAVTFMAAIGMHTHIFWRTAEVHDTELVHVAPLSASAGYRIRPASFRCGEHENAAVALDNQHTNAPSGRTLARHL